MREKSLWLPVEGFGTTIPNLLKLLIVCDIASLAGALPFSFLAGV